MSRVLALIVLGCLAAGPGVASGAAPPDSASPGGRDVLGDPLPPAAVLRLGSLRLQQSGAITGLFFGKDDRVLFAAADGAPLRAWEVGTGKESVVVGLPAGPVAAAAMTPGGRFLAAAGTDRVVRVVDLAIGKVVSQWRSGVAACTLLAFSGDGRTLAWLEPGQALHVRDLAAARDLRVLKAGATGLTNLALSPNGKLLATVHRDQVGIVLWDVGTGKRIRRYVEERYRGQPAGSLAFTPDGRSLVSTMEGKAQVWEIDSIEQKTTIEDATAVFGLAALSGDGKTLAAVNQGQTIRAYRVEGGKLLQSLDNLRDGVNAVAFSGNGKLLAVGASNGRVRLFDLGTGKEKALPGGWGRPAQGAGFLRGGTEVVTVAGDRISRWSVRTGKAVKHLPLNLETLSGVALSSDGEVAAVVTSEGAVRIFDTLRGVERCALPGTGENQGPFALSPDGRLAARLSFTEAEATLSLFDMRTGKPRLRRKLTGTTLGSQTLFFSSDSRMLYTGHSESDQLRVLEVATGKERRSCRLPRGLAAVREADSGEWRLMLRLLGKGGPAWGFLEATRAEWTRGLVFTSDNRAYVLPRGERLALYDRHTARPIRGFDGAEGEVDALALSPDGRLLAGGGSDTAVRLWNIATGRLLVSLAGHRGKIQQVAFSPDGGRLLSVSGDGTVLVWDVAAALRLPAGSAARPARRNVEALWRELASDDAAVAEQAIDEMAEQQAAAVRLLRKHLSPVPPVALDRLNRLIQDLDSNDAAVRDLATGQLAGLDELARAALQRAAGSPSAEVRKRVKNLLERLDRGELSGLQARPLRAVEVLEKVASPGARQLLAELAHGAADAVLTRGAADALRRLAARPPAEP